MVQDRARRPAVVGSGHVYHVDDRPIAEAVIQSVADADAVDPLEVPPLYEAIDPAALDGLVRHTAGPGRSRDDAHVSFTLANRWVTVWENGDIHVADPDESTR